MSELDKLYDVLNEQVEHYEKFLLIEKEKYDIIVKDDTIELDKLVSKEQVMFLKTRGLEAKRENVLKELNLGGKTFLEVIDNIDDSQRDRFTKLHDKMYRVLNELKLKNNECQELTQIRLHRAQNMIDKLSEKNQLNKQYFKDENTGEINVNKTNLLSKKV